MAYGWQDFNQGIVESIASRAVDAIDRAPARGLRCPLRKHSGEQLKWADVDYRLGTEWHADPLVRFHASPTYVLADPLVNFVFGRDMIADALGGGWGKAETHRLGNENSEDAVTWNVLRGLQEAGSLRLLAELLTRSKHEREPKLFLWGRGIDLDATESWGELQVVRDEVEPGLRQQTEPDAALLVDGWGWILIEAKFGSLTTTYRGREERLTEWFVRYEPWCAEFLDVDELKKVAGAKFPEQLLRNVVVAGQLCGDDQRALVVALTRRTAPTAAAAIMTRTIRGRRVGFRELQWEEIYEALPEEERFATLRSYFETKSLNMRRAFAIGTKRA